MTNNALENLVSFVNNKGLIEPTRPPQINEPFYNEWMHQKIKHMALKCGDRLEVTHLERGQEAVATGILIDDSYTPYITLLINGKKLWKTRENEKKIWLGEIISVKKTEDAAPTFDCKTVNPFYRSQEELTEIRREKTERKFLVPERDIEKFHNTYPDLDFFEHQILSLALSIYFPFSNAKIAGVELNVVRKDTTTVALPEYKIKQIHPNRGYYTVCGKERGSEELLLPFSTIEELMDIKYISCLWKIQIDDGHEFAVLYMTYPTFEEHPQGYNIFNVNAHETVLSIHEESLYKHTVFSGNIYTNYDLVGVLYDEEELFIINGKSSKNVDLDMAFALHNNDPLEVVASLSGGWTEKVEVFMKKEVIESWYFICDVPREDRYKRINEKLDFSRFLKSSIL